MKRHVVVLLVVLAASVWFQAWFLGLTPHGTKLGDPKLSDAYTEALAHGQSYLLAEPDSRLLAAKDPFGPATQSLLIWDTSYFHGHFYMYFGIVPFVGFMVPWLKATGHPPSPELALLFFSVLGYAAYGGLLLFAIRRWFPNASSILAGIAFLTVIVASGTWPLMGRPAIYEIENAAAYAFMGLSLWALARYELGQERPARFLTLAAALAALTMGCRPNYFPSVGVLGGWTLFRSWTGARKARSGMVSAVAPLIAFSVVGLALGYWNFHRFGSLFDFGLKHTVSDDPALVRPLSTLANLPYHFHRYVLGRARLDRYFPFIQGQKEGPFQLTAGQEISNQVYGFLIVSPILMAALIPLLRRSVTGAPYRLFCRICLTAFCGNFLFMSSVTMSCYRYPADFLGPLAAVAAVGVLCISQLKIGRRILSGALVSIVLTWSVAGAVFESFSTAQTTELFDQKRPGDFRAAAKPFNQIVYKYEALSHDGPRAVQIEVRFPKDKYGKSEPLVVLGENGAEDFVYIYYSGPGIIQIGYESSGFGGVLSPPFSVDFGTPHEIEIQCGSCLPPDDNPLFAGFDPSDVFLDREIIFVTVDGSPALDANVTFHLPRAQIFVGKSPFDSAFGSSFSGSIEYSTRPRLPTFLSPRRWDHDSYGPLSFKMRTTPMPIGILEPILTFGSGSNGAQILLEHLIAQTVRFVWVTTQGIRVSSTSFKWQDNETRSLEISVGSLFPTHGASLWRSEDKTGRESELKGTLTIAMQGSEVWRISQASPDVSPTAVFVGEDRLYRTSGVLPALPAGAADIHRNRW